MEWMRAIPIGLATGSAVLNMVQFFRQKREREVFASQIISVHRALGAALLHGTHLLTTTKGLPEENADTKRQEALRSVSASAGVVYGAIMTAFQEVSGFGESYLKLRMAPWKEVAAELKKEAIQPE